MANIKPKEDDKKECSRLIAFIFIDGTDEKQCGSLMKSLETDCSFGKIDGTLMVLNLHCGC